MKRWYILVIMLLLYSCSKVSNQGEINTKIKKTEVQKQDKTYVKLKKQAYKLLEYAKEKKYNTQYAILVDMSIHSGKNRMFVWDFVQDTILYSGLCAHGIGKGSTQEQPVYSNENGSYCTSLGKYKLGKRSYSQWGIKVHYKMHGLEKTNDNAYERIVVLHSHTPIQKKEIYPQHLPLGYSLGCPVINDELMMKIDKLLQKQKKSVLLWIYE